MKSITIVLSGIVGLAISSAPAAQPRAAQSQGQKLMVVNAGQIADSPNRFYNQKVKVTAEVEEVFGRAVFTLDEDRIGAAPDVLVVAPGGSQAPLDGSTVTVIGTLRPFVTTDIYDDYDWYGYGWYDYNWYDYNDVWLTWNQRPVIVADSIQTETGRQLVQQRKQGTRSQQARVSERIYVAPPGRIAQNPNDYYGHSVSTRSQVADVFGSRAFTLDEDRWFAGPDVLVLVPHAAAAVTRGATVTVAGQVRPFNIQQFERDYEWFDQEMFGDPDLLEQWEQDRRPAIVARSVRTQAGRELVQSPTRQPEAAGGTSATRQQSRASGQTSVRESRQESNDSTKAQQMIEDWYPTPKKAAQAMLQKYGQPQEVTPERLVWHNTSPFKRTIVINEQIQHNFPMPHHDALEQFIDYTVPTDKADELLRFDGSLIIERTRGELSARCDKEPANFLALNLAHDIVTGKKSVEQARKAYAEIAHAMLEGEEHPYIQSLQFSPPGSAGDPDQTLMRPQRSQAQGGAGSQEQTQSGQAGGVRQVILVTKNMQYHPSRIEAAPGERIQITITNASDASRHSIEFELPSGEVALPSPVPSGGKASLTLQAPSQPGEYVFYCPVAQHHDRGMEGKLVVRGAAGQSQQQQNTSRNRQ